MIGIVSLNAPLELDSPRFRDPDDEGVLEAEITFKGIKFEKISSKLTKKLKIKERGQDRYRLVLNPGNNYLISKNDQAILICQDEEDVQMIDMANIIKQQQNGNPSYEIDMTSEKVKISAENLNQIYEITKPESPSSTPITAKFESEKKVPLLLSHSYKIEDISREAMIIEDASLVENISDHIIVSGIYPDVIQFVQRIKKLSALEKRTIVILGTEAPDDNSFLKLKAFPGVFFCFGDSNRFRRLQEGWIRESSRCYYTQRHLRSW